MLRGALLALAALVATAVQAWPPDPAINVPVAATFERETDPQIVPDGSGGAIVFWRLHVLSPPPTTYYRYYLRANRLDADGTLVWPQPAALGQIALMGPVVGGAVATGDGGFIVASSALMEPDYNVEAARVDLSGSVSWSSSVIFTVGAQLDPGLASDGQGGVIVAWQDARSSPYDVYAQRLNGSGTPLWPADGVPICVATGPQTLARVVADGAGGAIVAWIDGRSATSQVFAQRLAANGTVLWPTDGVALAPGAGNQSALVLVSDGAGGAIAAWLDERNAGDPDVWAQRIDGLGAPQWGLSGVAVAAVPGAAKPALTPDGLGGVILAWSDARNGAAGLDVFAQRLSPSGVPAWTPNGVAVASAVGNQSGPSLASDGLGGAIVGWVDERSGVSDVYAQRLDASGAPLWKPGGRPISTASGVQRNLALASDGAGGAILAWEDVRGSSQDVYAQHVDAGGALPVTLQSWVIE